MNRRINKCIHEHFQKLKEDIYNSAIHNDSISVENLIHQLTNYPPLVLKPTDYEKRQRTKNIVPLYERCKAKRANGLQCTRRRKTDKLLCGTHIKGTPHGIIDIKTDENPLKKLDVWIQEINGINYYIDGDNNVYDPQDVYQNKINPRRIHKYEKNSDDKYIILDL